VAALYDVAHDIALHHRGNRGDHKGRPQQYRRTILPGAPCGIGISLSPHFSKYTDCDKAMPKFLRG
jgi:hypothetical protein